MLLSEATHPLVDARVRDLGSHRLKDLTAPERIYQLEAELPARELADARAAAGAANLETVVAAAEEILGGAPAEHGS